MIFASAKAQDDIRLKDGELSGEGYAIKGNVVYYKWETYPEASVWYSKKDIRAKKKQDEQYKTPLPLADAKTFKSLNKEYGMDYRNVFYQGDIIEGSDPNTFTQIEQQGQYYKDKNNVYLYGKVLEGVDAGTFRFHTDRNYTLDKNNVYYQGIALDVDPDNFTLLGDYLIGSNKVYWRQYLCANINASSFRLLEDDYATDGNIVIYRDELCADMNADSFRLLEDGYATDGNIVAFHGRLLDADGATFRKFLTPEGTGYSPYRASFYIDKHRLYFDGRPVDDTGPDSRILGKNYMISNDKAFYRAEVISGADAGSFISLSEYWGKDKHKIYFENKPIEGSGSDGLILGEFHMISNNKVFYHTGVISGADADSFTSLSAYLGKDKQTVYYKNKPIEAADAATFKSVYYKNRNWFGFDKNHLFEEDKIRMVIDGNSFRHLKDFIYVDDNFAYIISGNHTNKIPVDGKTFEEVGWNGEKMVYKDKNHTYKYHNGKLKKVRRFRKILSKNIYYR